MIVAFWIVTGVTAFAFFGAGLLKLARSRAALIGSGMGWAGDFGTTSIKLIGLAEVLGALGLVLPVLLDRASVLSPIAGFALAVLMLGAAVVHARRNELIVPPLALGTLALASAILALVLI